MGDRNQNTADHSSLPIPTYEEAIASRPSSSASFLGPSEVSHDAERQGLLSRSASNYQPPTVESARSSLDFLPSSSGSSPRNSDEGLRREMSELEVLDPEYTEQSQMGAMLAKRISSLSRGLSSLHLPIRNYFSSFRFSMPTLPEGFKFSPIIFIRLFAFLLVMGVAYLIFFSDMMRFRRGFGGVLSPPMSDLIHHLRMNVNETRIRENLRLASEYGHVAGTAGSYSIANWIQETMEEAGLELVQKEEFQVYLNWPRKDGRKLEIKSPQDKVFQAALEEDQVYQEARQQEYVFHGHSKSGTAEGPLIYANYGSREDFQKLHEEGIDVNGAVVLVRYYGSQVDPSLKVKAAEEAGAIGCVIYSDPQEDGYAKGSVLPDGRWRPADSVQRGSVSLMNWIVGDPLSPGFASTPEEKNRVPLANNPGLNKIPSLPIAWRDAKPLLEALRGHGKKMENDWVGAEVERWTGSKDGPVVYLENMLDEEEKHSIYNVLGRIEGIEQPTHPIIIGSHHDAWCFGAVDPGSGTAIFLELVRLFGSLHQIGWRPRRTIEFASWDAEEYNMIGSTEHVENRIDELRKNAFAYINVNSAISGEEFTVAGSPIMERVLLETLNHVMHPTRGVTMRKWWAEARKRMVGLGTGSDVVAFQNLAGTSSIDIGFRGPEHGYPYHSCYDTFEWMENFGDPGFQIHKAMGQIWALVAVSLADERVLPLDLVPYANAIENYINDLDEYARSKEIDLDLQALREANAELANQASDFHQYSLQLNSVLQQQQGYESSMMRLDRLKYNRRLARFETDLLDIDGGLPGREQFKHVITSPQAWSSYDEAYFPGPRDAIEAGDLEEAHRQVTKVASILRNATNNLVMREKEKSDK